MTLAAALIKTFALIGCLLFPLQGEESIPLFSPPKGWRKVDSPSPQVKASFLLKTSKDFCPSLNFTQERVAVSQEQYLHSLEKIYTTHSDHRFRKLGILQTKSGKAHLTSLDMDTAAGKVRVLQSIFFQETTAYILTGVLPLNEFGRYQQDLIDTFCSLTFVTNLQDYICDPDKKELFKQKNKESFSSKELSSFNQLIMKEFSKEGLYWQHLALEESSKKLIAIPTQK